MINQAVCLLGCLAVFGCNHEKPTHEKPVAHAPASAVIAEPKDTLFSKYGGRLEGFLDSVGHLKVQPLADKAAYLADSVFYHQLQSNQSVIPPNDFRILKQAARKGFISVKTARRIFNNPRISYDCNLKNVLVSYKRGLIPIMYYPFNGSGFDEFALSVGEPGHCTDAWLYYFKHNRIIAKQNGYSHYGLDMNSYQDSDGKTVVYYRYEFTDGSGIWWNNYFFYKYDGDTLIPILNELQNGNLLSYWGGRTLWLESFVEKTNPLTMKMVYHTELPDTAKLNQDLWIIDDSTTIEYTWNEQLKKLEGQYSKSKITKPQILSYYVEDNDLLFINSYYQTVKKALHDSATQKGTLIYLNGVKNYCNRQRMEKAKK